MYPHSITHTIQFPVIDLCNTCATKNIVFPGLEVFEEGIKLPLLYMIFYDYSFRSSVGDTAWKKLILETEDPTEPLAPEQGEGLLCFYLGTTTLLGCGKPNRNTRIYWSLNWAWRTKCIHIHGTTNQKAEDFKVIQGVHSNDEEGKFKGWSTRAGEDLSVLTDKLQTVSSKEKVFRRAYRHIYKQKIVASSKKKKANKEPKPVNYQTKIWNLEVIESVEI